MPALEFGKTVRCRAIVAAVSLLGLLVTLALPGRAADSADAGQPPRLTVAGKVVNAEGQPVSGAQVVLREWSSYRRGEEPFAPVQDILAKTTTDAQGEFRFQDVATRPFQREWPNPTPWDIVVQAEGYGLAWHHLLTDETPPPLRIALARQAEVNGQVLDGEGKPVAGARVSAEELAPLGSPMHVEYLPLNRLDLGMSQVAPATQTDAQGRFRLGGLPPEMRMTLMFQHDDFVHQSAFVATSDEPQPELTSYFVTDGKPQSVSYPVASGKVEVKLQPGCRLTGQVRYADTGKPCAGAQVALTSPNWYPAVSDAQGQFTVTGVAPAEYQLMAYPPADAVYLVRQLQLTIEAKEKTKSLTISLDPGQLVTGRVLANDTRKGVPGAQVYYQSQKVPSGPDRSLARAGVSDAEGKFRVIAPPGEAELVVSGPVAKYYIPVWSFREAPHPRFTKPIQVVAGKPLEGVTFEVTRGLVIGGIVTDPKGQPVAGAEVLPVRSELDEDAPSEATQTDEAGHFTLSGLPTTEPQEVLVIHPDRKLIGSARIEAAATEVPTRTVVVTVQLQPAAMVRGQVAVAGKPQAGASVTLLIYRREKEQRYAVASDVATTDAQGKYQFEMLEAGEEYAVGCSEPGYSQEQTETFRPKAGEEVELAPLDLLRTDRSVGGIVVDPSGKPLEGVVVNALTRAGRRIGGATSQTPTGKDGRFTIEAVPDEPLTLVGYLAPPPGAGPSAVSPSARVDATPGQTDARIVLNPTQPAQKPEKKE